MRPTWTNRASMGTYSKLLPYSRSLENLEALTQRLVAQISATRCQNHLQCSPKVANPVRPSQGYIGGLSEKTLSRISGKHFSTVKQSAALTSIAWTHIRRSSSSFPGPSMTHSDWDLCSSDLQGLTKTWSTNLSMLYVSWATVELTSRFKVLKAFFILIFLSIAPLRCSWNCSWEVITTWDPDNHNQLA